MKNIYISLSSLLLINGDFFNKIKDTLLLSCSQSSTWVMWGSMTEISVHIIACAHPVLKHIKNKVFSMSFSLGRKITDYKLMLRFGTAMG